MLKFLICFFVFIISFVLYCCICCGSDYDKYIDDAEQEKFLRNRE